MKQIILFIFILISTSSYSQESMEDWYHNSPSDGYLGVSAKSNSIYNSTNLQTVVVAVMDSGVDAEHEDLREIMWTNSDEIPNNNIDDDHNGYIDDIHGWNFIGNKNGENVKYDSYEVTRLYKKFDTVYKNADESTLNEKQTAEYEKYKKYKRVVEKKKSNAQSILDQIELTEGYILGILTHIQEGLGDLSLNLENLDSLDTVDPAENAMMKNILGRMLEEEEEIKEDLLIDELINEAMYEFQLQKEHYQVELDYAYNVDYNSRKIVGDNYADPYQKYYGNNNVEGPDALHGTHVAGIIGAHRDNDVGMNGLGAKVRIMSVRVVPDGDERDKDVANGIRYAVDNGASIINMSFGKGQSWNKKVVDDAVRYAEKKGVLIIHAAGNSAQNNDESLNFPNDRYEKKRGFFLNKKRYAQNWLEIGANTPVKDKNAVAVFSNYGQTNVDIFAPGTEIYSTTPNDEYQFLQGTSMAAPVVSGVAAAILSKHPKLSAKQLKKIILTSAYKLNLEVVLPGTSEMVSFSKLSVAGGIINLEQALKLAANTKGKRKRKNKLKNN